MDSGDREAAAIYGDAICDGERGSERWGVDSDTASFGVQVERFDRAKVFDDPGEHVACEASAIEFTAFRAEG